MNDPSNADDRLALAGSLLQLGDPCGVPLLEATARSAVGARSVYAAFQLCRHDLLLACTLMLHIADDGDQEAKASLVSQIWNITHSPHAFTADGIHEARQWVDQQLARLRAGAVSARAGAENDLWWR